MRIIKKIKNDLNGLSPLFMFNIVDNEIFVRTQLIEDCETHDLEMTDSKNILDELDEYLEEIWKETFFIEAKMPCTREKFKHSIIICSKERAIVEKSLNPDKKIIIQNNLYFPEYYVPWYKEVLFLVNTDDYNTVNWPYQIFISKTGKNFCFKPMLDYSSKLQPIFYDKEFDKEFDEEFDEDECLS